VEWVTRILRTTIHTMLKPAGQQGSPLIPRPRWAVERTLEWLTEHRRLAWD
jgi:hypothetical protein